MIILFPVWIPSLKLKRASKALLEGESQNLRLINHHFTAISSHFFGIAIGIFHITDTVGIMSLEIGKKVLGAFDNIFHVYLMNGLQKYQKKIFFHGGFLR